MLSEQDEYKHPLPCMMTLFPTPHSLLPSMSNVFDQALILTGPTGSGKSALAHRLACEFPIEIISMDSMAFFRQMDIGTAKPSLTERQEVRYHLVDCLDPWESSSVAWWLSQAEKCIGEIVERQHIPLIVGGTPLYLKTILHGMFEGPVIDPALRERLETLSTEELVVQLKPVDPAAAERIHPNDHRRLVRALEVYYQTGQPLSDMQQEFKSIPRERINPVLCVDLPRAELYSRINQRVDAMIRSGWLDEVKQLKALDQPLSKEAAQAAGYRELLDHLAGQFTLLETIDRIKTRTRQLAKRQLTWFRHLTSIIPLSPPEAEVALRHQISSMTPAIGSAGSPL